MRKIIAFGLSVIMAVSMSISAMAAPETNETKTVVVSIEDVIDNTSTRAASATKSLAKDSATLYSTGTITSVGQVIDVSSVLPKNATVTNVTIYCPKSVKITQSRFTAIENYIISNSAAKATVKFWQTDTPPSTSKTKSLNGLVTTANSKWTIQVQGRVAMNETGFDGFTVNAGGKLIIEYN